MSPIGSMRSESIRPAQLGGTLFVPATHPQLRSVVDGSKYPRLRSVVIDFEDGIDDAARPEALERLRALMPSLDTPKPFSFIRPDTPGTLAKIVSMNGVNNIDGFVLPKFGLDNADDWLNPLFGKPFAFMPTIEKRDLFSQEKLAELAEMLVPFREQIPTVRFGLEDMLRQLGMIRDCDTPLYTLIAPAQVIATMITAFKPMGFNVSGGVYKCYQDMDGFKAELQEDLRQGLFGKTIIHPSQIAAVEEAYKVSAAERNMAETIVNATTNVSAFDGLMIEKPTQLPWARTILERAKLYGVSA